MFGKQEDVVDVVQATVWRLGRFHLIKKYTFAVWGRAHQSGLEAKN
jgi:hypothetical protein